MDKTVKPVFPKSIEEHDREVNETWLKDNGFGNPFKDVYEGMIEEQLGEKGLLRHLVDKQHIDDPLFGHKLLYFLKISDDFKIEMAITNVKTEVSIYYPTPGQKLYADDIVYESIEYEEVETLQIFETFNEALDFVVETIKNNTKKASDYKCEFCCDGASKDEAKSLFKEELCLEKTPIADIDIYVDENNELAMLVRNAAELTIIHTTMKIKHCPMCGRLLDNKHEQDNLSQLMKETMLMQNKGGE